MSTEATSSSSSKPGKLSRLLRVIWRVLIDPISTIPLEEARRRARLLSALLIALTGSLFLGAIFNAEASTTVAALLLVVAYGLSRTRHYPIAVLITIVALEMPTLFSLATLNEYTARAIFISARWLIFPIILASLWFAAWGTALLGLSNFAGLIIFWLLTPQVEQLAMIALLGVIGTTVMLVTAASVVQAADLKQIERHAEELEQRVAERTSELEAINEELKALSQVQDEFVANVSHELRSPITSIKLHHHLVALRPNDIDNLLPVLNRETQRLELIIEDLLRLSRMDIGEVSLELTRLDLNQLVAQYVADRAPMAASGGRMIQLGKRDTVPHVMADEGLLGQVLGSLLTNALNYSPQGSAITVGTSTRQQSGMSWVVISVSDNGDGITPDEMTHLFERFYRGVAGRESGQPGTGLGLSIVHEIVERHGGQVEVESEGLPSKGATFHVWLPVEEDLHG